MARSFEVIQYEDVVKNDEGQWIVNSVVRTGVRIEIDSKTTLRDVAQFLKSNGFTTIADLRKLVISDLDSDIIEVKLKKEMEPVCRLERRLTLH